MKKMIFTGFCIIIFAVSCKCSGAAEGFAATLPSVEAAPEGDSKVSFDKMVHDFGDVSVSDGPLSCTFTLTNKGSEPISIYEVVSSCGCTGVEWSKKSIGPGEKGTIKASYKNEDGPNTFDKTLTVYITGVQRPVILRLRGVVHERKKSLSELYPVRLGPLGLKSLEYKAGTLVQGESVSESVKVANLSEEPAKVEFEEVSAWMKISVSPNPVPAGSEGAMTFTILSSDKLYGKNYYTAVPLVNGKQFQEISVWAITRANFASWSKEQRDNGALSVFSSSTFDFGKVKAGNTVKGSFSFTNKGKSPLHFYKVDSETQALSVSLPADVPAQGKGSVEFVLDTNGLPKGENVIMISLYLNSPLRPVVNLFVAGIIL